MAMHWGEEFLSGRATDGTAMHGVNALTTSAYCPVSRQPELKHAAVRVERAELPWRLLALAWLPEDHALRAREQLKALMGEFAFASCVPFGRERTGVLLRAAGPDPAPAELLQRIERIIGLDEGQALRYEDQRRGQRRTMRLAPIDGQTQLQAFLLGGDISAEVWLRPLLQDELPAQAYGRLLLVPGPDAPVAVQARGRQVCTCFNVTEPRIVEVLARCDGPPAERLLQLQTELKCGTNCGSCVPELKRMVAQGVVVA